MLRNWYQPNLACGKLEQFQIPLQNKKSVLVFSVFDERPSEREDVLGNAALASLNYRRGKADMHNNRAILGSRKRMRHHAGQFGLSQEKLVKIGLAQNFPHCRSRSGKDYFCAPAPGPLLKA